MAQVLVRNLDDRAVEKLKQRAARHGRSLHAELRPIREDAARVDMEEARRLSQRIRRKLAGRGHSDSTELLAEDRRR